MATYDGANGESLKGTGPYYALLRGTCLVAGFRSHPYPKGVKGLLKGSFPSTDMIMDLGSGCIQADPNAVQTAS